MSRAGANVRQMAKKRRFKAVMTAIWAAGLTLLLLVLLITLSTAGGVSIPVWAYILCLLPLGKAALDVDYLLKRARQADQGAAGEEAIATLLSPLVEKGWTIEYGVEDASVGDIDVFLLSPRGKAYTIDVKSHRGLVRFNGQQLYRCHGQTRTPFEKDFLLQAQKQAIAMKNLRSLASVTPIVAFSQARVEVGQAAIAGVYVLGKHDLLRRLHYIEGAPPKKQT